MRVYSIEEANRLLPRLSSALERQFACVRAIETEVARLRELLGPTAPPNLHADPNDAEPVAAIKFALRDRIHAFQQGWAEVEATGGVLKDLKTGLVDFYTERDGELVALCWRYGEPTIGYWHAVGQSYKSRRPIPEAQN